MNEQRYMQNQLQIDIRSESFYQLQEDFYRYSTLDTPLTFLIDDILASMAKRQKNYFKLSAQKSQDGYEHRFYFKISSYPENRLVRLYTYTGMDTKWSRDAKTG
ncbi:DUF5960 family protein [Streptococcus moroccensis]|uniref:Uncharacterized protein n=1 Tax=Streptococcus moroccensis TaxID=1451356 RepID=A0ABT9YR62_9STRE|nr:DUF5960 family protein [Streptococcus moroccensis]MDQ0222481.1 hypothetical protein [Streptococcus moroccensis]